MIGNYPNIAHAVEYVIEESVLLRNDFIFIHIFIQFKSCYVFFTFNFDPIRDKLIDQNRMHNYRTNIIVKKNAETSYFIRSLSVLLKVPHIQMNHSRISGHRNFHESKELSKD